jgi:hypothetical protein
MSDLNATSPEVAQAPAVELTTKQKIEQINVQLKNLDATFMASEDIIKGKNIKIVNLADTSADPVALTITGNAVIDVIRPIITGVSGNRNQLITMKEQLLAQREAELNEGK